ncbi:hypothetical protein [Sinorhizobium meliloti]|uniref:hypothetical protein n=1 Tax=Rhizobium meliloti TaxID=382 RepID=UPI0030CDCE3F
MDQALTFLDTVFWHTDPNGMTLWNAKLNKGWFRTISGSEGLLPDSATTMYAAFHKDKEKEALWERVRAEEFSHKPTRMKTTFLFVSREDVDVAMSTWFKGQDRDVLPVLVPTTSKLHIADTKLLDCAPSDWEGNARRYWTGEMTENPFREAVLEGPAYIPDTETMTPRLR